MRNSHFLLDKLDKPIFHTLEKKNSIFDPTSFRLHVRLNLPLTTYIFILTNSTWPISHPSLVDFLIRLVSVWCLPSLPIDH
jgi:hypothetical protein